MTLLYACSMDHYGPGTGPAYYVDDATKGWDVGWDAPILGDLWATKPTVGPNNISRASGSMDIKTPSWGARSGSYALVADQFAVARVGSGGGPYTFTHTECMRLPFPGASQATRIAHFAFSCSGLPAENYLQGQICHFMSAAGVRSTLAVTPAGRLQILDGTPIVMSNDGGGNPTQMPSSLLTSSAPVIEAQTWYSINIKITASGDVDVYVGDISAPNLVLSATGLSFTSYGNIDILGFLPASWSGDPDGGAVYGSETTQRAVRDIVMVDTAGSYNNDLLGQVFVSAQEIRAEDAGGGWTAFPRENFTPGILNSLAKEPKSYEVHANPGGIFIEDSSTLEIGAQDFTAETMVRFHTVSAIGGHESTLFAKWKTDTADRSYRLYYSGSDGELRWEVSSDGANPIVVKAVPWDPVTDIWYHIAVSRWTDTSGQYTSLFIDGDEAGIGVSDTATYYSGIATLGVGARFNLTTYSVFVQPMDNTSLDGFLDETRLTIGTGRYTTDFTPPSAAFGRNSGDDPEFADVVLLMGYEGGDIVDESYIGRTVNVTANTPDNEHIAVEAITPYDDESKHDVLNQRPPWDDTFIEAANLFADGTFKFTGLPTDAETVTIGSTTYTWVTAFDTVETNQVIIAGTTSSCVANLIAAINGAAGEGVTYGTGTLANADAVASVFVDPEFKLRALNIGATGNSVVTTTTMAAGAFDAATLTGGEDIPDDNDFSLERLPIDVTGILGVQVTARVHKSDAGSSAFQFNLVGPAGAVDTGASNTPDLNPAWVRQIFEEDPDTSASITPPTVIGGRLRFSRTS